MMPSMSFFPGFDEMMQKMAIVTSGVSQSKPGRKNINDPLFIKGNENIQKWKTQGVYDVVDDDDDLELNRQLQSFSCDVPGCVKKLQSLMEFEQHYKTHHQYECSQCRKHLASPHLLDLHLSETHDSFFAVASTKKPSFCCYVEECKIKFWDSKDRMQHCVDQHDYPSDFRYDESRKKSKSTQNKVVDESMETDSSKEVASSSKTEEKKRKKPINKKPNINKNKDCLGSGTQRKKKDNLNWYQKDTNKQKATTSTSTINVSDLESALPVVEPSIEMTEPDEK